MNDLTSGKIGMMILMLGSPFYLLLSTESFAVNFVSDYQSWVPLWANIIITIAFVIGFVMFFTTSDKTPITKYSKGDAE